MKLHGLSSLIITVCTGERKSTFFSVWCVSTDLFRWSEWLRKYVMTLKQDLLSCKLCKYKQLVSTHDIISKYFKPVGPKELPHKCNTIFVSTWYLPGYSQECEWHRESVPAVWPSRTGSGPASRSNGCPWTHTRGTLPHCSQLCWSWDLWLCRFACDEE